MQEDCAAAMCGLTGILSSHLPPIEAIRGMTEALRHRGPDDGDVWLDPQAGIAFGHRRLSIIELSNAGHQPMTSANGRFVVVFNGEIYNHLALRAKLDATGQSPAWRGHSDTETLLASFATWGVQATLRRAVGMFALAVWDRVERRLTLARDRLGEKPLFYGWVRGAFVFGSELKALRAYPEFDNPVSRDALAMYLEYCVVPAPYSIYEDIFKLEPGCELSLDASNLNSKTVQSEPYWRLTDAVRNGLAAPIESESEAVAELEATLREAVALQSVADVPLGAFLSGGVDSSTIVALMQARSSRPVQTFTVGFEEAGFDESPHALAVARHLGTEHHELRVSATDARAVIPQLPIMYDEPFADSSQIPTHLMCKAARSLVTVALSGDAGDELFGGYNRYLWGPRLWNRMKWIPQGLRRGIASGVARIPMRAWDALGRALPGPQGATLTRDKVQKLAKLTASTNLDDLYLRLVTEWPQAANLVYGAGRLSTRLDDASLVTGVSEAEQRMMLWDSLTYLPDDILTKVDRAAMSVSLETRVPFLDHRVVELAWRLPLHTKLRNGQGKWALRQVLYKYVPRELIERPKMGFAVPVGRWLRGPLREWAAQLLDPVHMGQQGYFNVQMVQEKWSEHLLGKRDWSSALWTVLMLQAWLAQEH